MTANVQGKVMVVTGATSGIGLAAARTFLGAGAAVIGVGRSVERNTRAQEDLHSEFPDTQVTYLLADLAEQVQVRRLADEIGITLKQWGYAGLDALVNNAGGYLEKKTMTVDGIEKTFAVNHLAPFLLTHLLLPWLQKADHGRVLTVSSYSHRVTTLGLNRITNPWPYVGLLAYKRSKLSNVLFTYEFNRRYDGVQAFAVDPGLVNTDIAAKGGHGISHLVWRSHRKQGTSPDVPAKTILFLAGADAVDTSKGYYFRNSVAQAPSRSARNPQLAECLWRLSEALTGVAREDYPQSLEN